MLCTRIMKLSFGTSEIVISFCCLVMPACQIEVDVLAVGMISCLFILLEEVLIDYLHVHKK